MTLLTENPSAPSQFTAKKKAPRNTEARGPLGRKGRESRPTFRLNPNKVRSWFLSLTEQLGHSRPFQPGSFETFPAQRFDTALFAQDYLASEVLSKLDDGVPSPQKAEATWSRFFEAETMCVETNRRLKQPSFGEDVMSHRSPYATILLAQRYMAKLLGRLDWNEVAVGFGWGPGASTRVKRRDAHPISKYNGRPWTTPDNVALASAAISAVPSWKACLDFEEGKGYCDIVPGNHIVTVPKSYKTDRTIAIEPDMNMYVQKGLGSVIRRRLKRVGIDLDDQSKNRRLAAIGSFAGTLATIDLSMASDTVSYELVRLLLPPEWFAALEQCRSRYGRLPQHVQEAYGKPEWIEYAKFSSMGNGYTFELESAIFCCLAWACAELWDEKDARISVYGDDIIVPSKLAPKLVRVLEVAGFKANPSKSFWTGGFRESCGFHALNGYDVSPFYIRRLPETLEDLFLLHNQLYRWCMRVAPIVDVDPFWDLLKQLRSWAPGKWCRPKIPDGVGDGAFIGTFDEACPPRAPHGYEGFLVDVRVALPIHWEEPLEHEWHQGRLTAALDKLSRTKRIAFETGDVNLSQAWKCDEVFGFPIPIGTRTVSSRMLVPQFVLLSPFNKD